MWIIYRLLLLLVKWVIQQGITRDIYRNGTAGNVATATLTVDVDAQISGTIVDARASGQLQ